LWEQPRRAIRAPSRHIAIRIFDVRWDATGWQNSAFVQFGLAAATRRVDQCPNRPSTGSISAASLRVPEGARRWPRPWLAATVSLPQQPGRPLPLAFRTETAQATAPRLAADSAQPQNRRGDCSNDRSARSPSFHSRVLVLPSLSAKSGRSSSLSRRFSC
jgi:hypothetical protein